MTKRILKYLLLAILTIVTPYVLTMLLIIVMGDRIEGMKLAAIPGIILPQFIFGLTFIERPLPMKVLFSIVISAIICGLIIATVRLQLLKTNFDLYGFWDLILSNFLIGFLVWEIFYHLNNSMRKSVNQ